MDAFCSFKAGWYSLGIFCGGSLDSHGFRTDFSIGYLQLFCACHQEARLRALELSLEMVLSQPARVGLQNATRMKRKGLEVKSSSRMKKASLECLFGHMLYLSLC